VTVGNEKQTRLEIEGQNSDESTDGAAVPMGYEDPAGITRAVPGDEDSAALKTPPFLTETAVWIPGTTVLSTAAYDFTSVLQIAKRRLIEVYIEFTADEEGGPSRLSLVPQIRRSRDPEALYPVGAVEIAPSIVTLDPPFDAVGSAVASRDIFISEFRTTAIPAGATYRNTLGFDISAYSGFQLGFMAPQGNGGVLRLDYAFSD
jgi:hypothetical protein